MPDGIKHLYGAQAGPGPSYFFAHLALGFSQSKGLYITRKLRFVDGSNFTSTDGVGTRFTSNWYKNGSYGYEILTTDPSSFDLDTQVCSLDNISYGTTYTFGGGNYSSVDTSTVYRCSCGYYSGTRVSTAEEYSYTPYKLTFNVNGGTFSGNVRLNNSNYTGSNYAIVALNGGYYNDMSDDIPSNGNSEFKGWYTSASGGTQVYDANGKAVPGTSYWDSNSRWIYKGNLTLYAQWEKLKYRITYYINDGTGASFYREKEYGSSHTIVDSSVTRDGYTFKGWSTSSTATTADYSVGSTYSENNNLILYGVWKKLFALSLEVYVNGIEATKDSEFSSIISGILYVNGRKITNNIMYYKGYHEEGSFYGIDYVIKDKRYERFKEEYLEGYLNSDTTMKIYLKKKSCTYVNVNSINTLGYTYVNENNLWKLGIPWINNNGDWKIGGI